MARRGRARRGMAWQGTANTLLPFGAVVVWRGKAGHGEAWPGKARHGTHKGGTGNGAALSFAPIFSFLRNSVAKLRIPR